MGTNSRQVHQEVRHNVLRSITNTPCYMRNEGETWVYIITKERIRRIKKVRESIEQHWNPLIRTAK